MGMSRQAGKEEPREELLRAPPNQPRAPTEVVGNAGLRARGPSDKGHSRLPATGGVRKHPPSGQGGGPVSRSPKPGHGMA